MRSREEAEIRNASGCARRLLRGRKCAPNVRTSGLRSLIFAILALQLTYERKDLARLASANIRR
jgi:hypothetical protein